MGIYAGIAARWLDSFLQPARMSVRVRAREGEAGWGNECPINFIAHLIDHKNYSFISTKIAKSAKHNALTAKKNRTDKARKRNTNKNKNKANLNDNSAAIDIYKICMSCGAGELGKK